jgi:O-antigen/teichoic acid export membrane protein
MITLSEIKKFISDVGITFFSSIVSMFLGFLLIIFLGRYMGAEDLGYYRMISTIFGIAMLFATMGIPVAIIKYVSEFNNDNEIKEEIVSAGLIASFFLGILSFAIVYLSANVVAHFFEMPELSSMLKILSFVFPFSIINSMLIGFINGIREMNKNAYVSIFQGTSLLILSIILVFNYGIDGAVWSIVLSSILTTLLILSLQRISSLSFQKLVSNSIQIINFGSKTVISNAVNLINYNADILMIGYFMASTDVGVYSVAVMFAKVIWLFPDSVQKITLPLISEYHAKNKQDYIKIVVDKCMKYSFLFLIFSSTFLFFFGAEIVDAIFGIEFEQAYFPLIILLIGTTIYGTTKSVGSIFASVGKVNLVYKIPLVSAIINIILNFVLIPSYGINGAAFATSFSLVISMCLMLYFMKSILNIKFDYMWYFKAFGVTSSLVIAYLLLISYSDLFINIILIVLQLTIYYQYFIPIDDKQRIHALFYMYKSHL